MAEPQLRAQASQCAKQARMGPGKSAEAVDSTGSTALAMDNADRSRGTSLGAALDETKERQTNTTAEDATQNEELNLLRAELATAQSQLAAILGSTSWRLTQPWRDLADRHPAIVARARRFLGRHPRVRQSLLGMAKLLWRTVTLQLVRRAIGRRHSLREPAIGIPSEMPPTLPVFDIKPIATCGGSNRLLRSKGPRLICISHVMPYPPQAGNEYRIHRMLTWLAGQNWEVLLVVCPLPNETLTARQLTEAAGIYQNLIVCQRDGRLFHRLVDDGAMLEGLRGRRPRAFPPRPGDPERIDERERKLLTIMRLFCPDALAELVLHLEAKFDPQVLLAEYVFMTRPFAMLRPELFKIIDTIDVFSTTYDKVVRYGIEEGLALASEVEAELINRADLLIAIQTAEADVLRKLAPHRQVISVGVDFTLLKDVPPSATRPVILFVASNNARNAKGLRDFLRFAWPLIRRQLPEAELRVIGSVGEAAEPTPPGVQILGHVEDLEGAYAEARVIINPAVAGTGLKIKTVEALCHFRPIVLWPSGVDGLEPQISQLCHIASNWFDFARHIIRLAGAVDGARVLIERRTMLEQQFAADTVYAPLGAALDNRKNGDTCKLELSRRLDPLKPASRQS